MEIPPEISASIDLFDQEFPPLTEAAHQMMADIRGRLKLFEERIGSALSILESGDGDTAAADTAEEMNSVAHDQEEWLDGYPGIMNPMLDRLHDALFFLSGHKVNYAKALWDAIGLDGMVGYLNDMIGEMRERIAFMEGVLDQLPRLAPPAPGDIDMYTEAIEYMGDVLYVVTISTTYLMKLKVSLWTGRPLPQRTS